MGCPDTLSSATSNGTSNDTEQGRHIKTLFLPNNVLLDNAREVQNMGLGQLKVTDIVTFLSQYSLEKNESMVLKMYSALLVLIGIAMTADNDDQLKDTSDKIISIANKVLSATGYKIIYLN